MILLGCLLVNIIHDMRILNGFLAMQIMGKTQYTFLTSRQLRAADSCKRAFSEYVIVAIL